MPRQKKTTTTDTEPVNAEQVTVKRKLGRPRTDNFEKKNRKQFEVLDMIPKDQAADIIAAGLKKKREALKSNECTNGKVAAFMDALFEIRVNADRENPETLYECMRKYLQLCQEVEMKISNMACYMACGVTKHDIDEWSNRQARVRDPRYKEFADTCKFVCSTAREQLANEGKINPVFAIWQQKVHDGFRDNEVVYVSDDTEKEKTAEQITKDFSDMIE